jgi:hypothetical protein
MSIAEYRRTAFLGRPPAAITVRRWLEAGDLPGEKIGGSWFVLVDESGEAYRPKKVTTGSAGADALLLAWAQNA